MTRWSFAVGPASGSGPLKELVSGVSSRSYTRRLVGPDEIEFTVNARQEAAGLLVERETDVWVHRDGVLAARGRLLTSKDSVTEDRHTVSCKAFGYEALLDDRGLDPTDGLLYFAVDQAEILWQLIVTTQAKTNGNLGITQGANGFTAGVGSTGVVRIRRYAADDNIGTLARQLSEVSDGFDFEIDALKRLQVYYPSRGTTSERMLHYGGNVNTVERAYNGGATANVVVARGAVGTTRTVATSAGLATDPRGRIEARIGLPTVVETGTLIERAGAAVVERALPSYGWRVGMRRGAWGGFGDWNVGDVGKLVVKSLPRLDVALTVRVHEITVKIGPSGEEDVAMKLETL